MQSSGSINQHHVGAISLSTLEGIEGNRSWIRSHLLLHHRHPNSLSPDADLFNGSSTESIGSTEINLLASLFKLIGQLADGSSFTHTIHTDNENDIRFVIGRQIPVVIIIRMIFREQISDFLAEDSVKLRGRNVLITSNSLFDAADDLHRSLHTDIRGNQNLLQIVEYIIING